MSFSGTIAAALCHGTSRLCCRTACAYSFLQTGLVHLRRSLPLIRKLSHPLDKDIYHTYWYSKWALLSYGLHYLWKILWLKSSTGYKEILLLKWKGLEKYLIPVEALSSPSTHTSSVLVLNLFVWHVSRQLVEQIGDPTKHIHC